ncbi:MAG: nucleotidyltransferase family protein, partial [Ruminococcus sp.]|nr:nucleotidyltransferase family protein [Ruminococcus sp.]
MKIAAVVAEYNPFHNGHRYHLEETRRRGADHIVVIMSGTAVQRGDIAVFDKYARADIAVKNGADLVIELSCPFSCSGAEVFAGAAVQLMAGLGEGVVEVLSFGCEDDELDTLVRCAEVSERLSNSDKVKHLIAQGRSYPSSVAAAAEDDDVRRTLSSPNNVLAVEYIKAIRKYAPWISPCAVKRHLCAHDSMKAESDYASGSLIRQRLADGYDIAAYVPKVPEGKGYFLKNADKVLLYKIMTAGEELGSLPDMNPALLNRFADLRDRGGFATAEEFLAVLKNKNITLARLRRSLMHLALGIRAEDIRPVPYGRILAFNKAGCGILSAAKERTLTFDTSLARLEKLSPYSARVCELETNAVRFQQLCTLGR